MHYRHILAILTLQLGLAGCGIFSGDEDKTLDWSANKLYSEANTALKEGDYDQAVKYYEKLEARYPFGRYATQAQINQAYASYKADEPDAAIAAADRFIKLHPQDPHVDYAYYLKGVVNYNRSIGFLDRYIPSDQSQRDPGSARDSFQDFSELLRLFPNSKYAPDARQRMLYLRNNLAKNEVHVANYYLRRGAYLAAAKRAATVVENYPRTTAVEEALEVMIAAYTALDMPKLAGDARRVLEVNKAKGAFEAVKEPTDTDLSHEIWQYLELDKN
jgi:outer membrane protein assembly factor BamD